MVSLLVERGSQCLEQLNLGSQHYYYIGSTGLFSLSLGVAHRPFARECSLRSYIVLMSSDLDA